MQIDFRTSPDKYRHWKLDFDGPVATLTMDVDEKGGLRPDYELKLNSYDLGVDIELSDAIQRLRFEHPEVKVVILRSGKERVFCAGANIRMLSSSTHAHKVNFCKFTNETRNGMEAASTDSGQYYICAVNGTAAGGGYELALATDYIVMVDDNAAAVSLPELPLLAVLPGTGGLTRVTDKRKVRRDRADIFCTLAEGIRGKRAKRWNLIDEIAPKSKFTDRIAARAREWAEQGPDLSDRQGITLDAIEPEIDGGTRRYSSVTIAHDADKRVAQLTITVPPASQAPSSPEEIHAQGAQFWPLRMCRELDAAILDLRTNHRSTGLVLVRTRGNLDDILAWDQRLIDHPSHWLMKEITLLMSHTLRRVERTACSFFALIDQGSCFGGSLLDLALACDRTYMLEEDGVEIARSAMNEGLLPMTSGITRSACRLLGEPDVALQEPSGETWRYCSGSVVRRITFSDNRVTSWGKKVGLGYMLTGPPFEPW